MVDNTLAQLIHLRLLAGDVSAGFDCVQFWLPELEGILASRYRDTAQRDFSIITSAALDALYDYTSDPSRFDARRSSLLSYMQMIARRDLQNALDREHTQNRITTSLEDVELFVSDRNESDEEMIDRIDARSLWQVVQREIPDPLDQQFLLLTLSGERTTAPFARLLGLVGKPDAEQRAAVKRAKDRLSKRLARLGDTVHE